MTSKPIHVCIRRKNQLFYIICDPSHQTADYLKQQVAVASPENEQSDMKLLTTAGAELDGSLEDLENEQELHLVMRLSDSEYEPVDLGRLDPVE